MTCPVSQCLQACASRGKGSVLGTPCRAESDCRPVVALRRRLLVSNLAAVSELTGFIAKQILRSVLLFIEKTSQSALHRGGRTRSCHRGREVLGKRIEYPLDQGLWPTH